MTTAAGWYPDPDDASQLRYWDGTAWTDHRHPAAPSGPDGADDGTGDSDGEIDDDGQMARSAEDPTVPVAPLPGVTDGAGESDLTVPRPIWEPAPPPPTPPSESGSGSKKRTALIVLGLLIIVALVGGGLFWFLSDDDSTTYTWNGIDIADPDATIDEADAVFADDARNRSGATVDESRCYFTQSTDTDTENPGDVGDEVLCGPVLFFDDDPDDGVFVGFPLSAEENDDGDIELSVGDEPSRPRPGPVDDDQELIRPDGAQPPADNGGIEGPEPPEAIAGLVLVDDDLLDDVTLDDASAIVVGRTTSVELTGLASPDRIGSHEQARRAADGERFIVFELVLAPGDSYFGSAREQSDRFDNSDATIDVDIDGVGSSFLGPDDLRSVRGLVSVPEDADVADLVLTDSGIEQRLSLLDGEPGDDNIAVLSRDNRDVVIDETVTIPGVITFPDGQTTTEDFNITVRGVGLLYYVTDAPHIQPSAPSLAFLVMQHFITTSEITEEDGIALEPGHVRLYAGEEEYDAVNLASEQGQVLVAFEVPADFTMGTITIHGEAPSGDLVVAFPEPAHVDFEVEAG